MINTLSCGHHIQIVLFNGFPLNFSILSRKSERSREDYSLIACIKSYYLIHLFLIVLCALYLNGFLLLSAIGKWMIINVIWNSELQIKSFLSFLVCVFKDLMSKAIGD